MTRRAPADIWPAVTVADGRRVMGHIYDSAKGITATDAEGVAIGTKFPDRHEAMAAIIEHDRTSRSGAA